MAELYVGTSGWNYKHWRGRFYPEDVPIKKWLDFYSEHFNTAEVNYSFYRLPQQSTYQKWLGQVPEGFLFTLKCSRIITHNKRLSNLGDLWINFLTNAVRLGDQLGPILCQFPDSFKLDALRLDSFLESAARAAEHDLTIRLAVEFRDESWYCKDVYRILEKYNVALVAADSSVYPREDRVTADFAYFRYHGPGRLFGSDYSRRQLEAEAAKMIKIYKQGLDVFAYFNNDGQAFAVKDALILNELLSVARNNQRTRRAS
jgi:uncharacterized protein YecE (DUF72 family)